MGSRLGCMKAATPLFEANPANACQSYKNLRDANCPHAVDGREHCEDLWTDFAALADDNFATEFQLRLHERWFEMYLTVSLLRAGLTIECPKPGPDILLHAGDRRIWIEAVCATPGEVGRPDSVPPREYSKLGEKPVVREVPQDQIVLRLRNSLAEKATKYQGYIDSGIVSENDILVVAINAHAVVGVMADTETFLMRALYGIGNLVLELDVATRRVVGRKNEQLVAISKIASGAEVGVQPFIDSSMPHLSAVLGSSADAVNLPDQLGGDLALYPNLTSTRPWAGGAVRLGLEWSFDEAEGEWEGRKRSFVAEQ